MSIWQMEKQMLGKAACSMSPGYYKDNLDSEPNLSESKALEGWEKKP
jgi:hypothetical protein